MARRMTNDATALIGHIVDVQGREFIAALADGEEGAAPTVTIGDEDVVVGRLGSYVRVKQGDVSVVAMVARMTEREQVEPAAPGEPREDPMRLPYARRTVKLVPLGSLGRDGAFERGVPVYPTTGAEVHALASSQLDTIFARYRAKEYDVGRLASNPDQRVFLDPTKLFGRHTAILGQTGAGKSWTTASLLQRAVSLMPRAHVVLLDLHGEYRRAFSGGIAQTVNAVDLEMPYWLMTYEELCDLLVDRSEFSAHNQTAFFRDTVNALRKAEGERIGLDRTTVDTPVYFSLDALRDTIRAENERKGVGAKGQPVKGPMEGEFDRFLMRLDSRLNDVRYDFLLRPRRRTTSASLVALLRDFIGLSDPKRAITVIDLSPVPFDVRPTVVAQIGRLAFEFNYWNPRHREFPILLVCEEAHGYIPRETITQFAGARRSMERVAKEGRKYGVGLLVVSQRPHEVSETVLSQCGTFICLRITNPDDQSYVRALVPEGERDLVDILAGLGRGEGMVLGEAPPLPTRVQFDRPDPQPTSDDVDFYEQWRSGPDDINVDAVVDRWRRQDR